MHGGYSNFKIIHQTLDGLSESVMFIEISNFF